MNNNNTYTFAFIIVAVLLVGFFVTLHLSKPNAPSEFKWDAPPDIMVCDTAPAWVTEEMFDVTVRLADNDIILGSVYFDQNCSKLCDGPFGTVPCHKGRVIIDRATSNMIDDHFGKTGGEIRLSDNKPVWMTTVIPDILKADYPLPEDIYEMVLAHELLHALGFNHIELKLFGITHHKSGHILNPQSKDIGWNMKWIKNKY